MDLLKVRLRRLRLGSGPARQAPTASASPCALVERHPDDLLLWCDQFFAGSCEVLRGFRLFGSREKENARDDRCRSQYACAKNAGPQAGDPGRDDQ